MKRDDKLIFIAVGIFLGIVGFITTTDEDLYPLIILPIAFPIIFVIFYKHDLKQIIKEKDVEND